MSVYCVPLNFFAAEQNNNQSFIYLANSITKPKHLDLVTSPRSARIVRGVCRDVTACGPLEGPAQTRPLLVLREHTL